MKDYTELEQVKECRDEYKKSLYGELDLFFQRGFFSEYQKEIEGFLNTFNHNLEKKRVKANECFVVPVREVRHPEPGHRLMFCVLRDDGYLYVASSYPLAVLGIGYRMKDGKVEVID